MRPEKARRQDSNFRATLFAACAAILAFALGRASAQANARPWVELIEIDGSINPAVTNYVEDALSAAESGGASALVIRLDTPGGLLTSAERIVKLLLSAPVPTIVYVAPSGASAASAGTFITEAANVAAMAPGTTIGAAHPVSETGGTIKGAMGEKLVNYTASFARSIARERGRNEQWMEEAVRHSAAIGEHEALEKHVIDIVAPDLRSVLVQASGRTVEVRSRSVKLDLADATVRVYEMTLGQRILNLLSDPNIVYLLLMAGLIGLYFEFAHPGAIFPGVAGAICLLLALASFQVLPVNVSGLLLILLGVAMLIAEAFVTSYGILGLGGVVALVFGSLLLIDTSKTNLVVNRQIIYGAAAALSSIILSLGYLLARERRKVARTGLEALVGEVGVVRDPIRPGAAGTLFVHGELWRATSDEALGAGAQATVVSVHGLEVRVRRAA